MVLFPVTRHYLLRLIRLCEWFHAVAQLLRKQSFSLPFASGRDRWP